MRTLFHEATWLRSRYPGTESSLQDVRPLCRNSCCTAAVKWKVERKSSGHIGGLTSVRADSNKNCFPMIKPDFGEHRHLRVLLCRKRSSFNLLTISEVHKLYTLMAVMPASFSLAISSSTFSTYKMSEYEYSWGVNRDYVENFDLSASHAFGWLCHFQSLQ